MPSIASQPRMLNGRGRREEKKGSRCCDPRTRRYPNKEAQIVLMRKPPIGKQVQVWYGKSRWERERLHLHGKVGVVRFASGNGTVRGHHAGVGNHGIVIDGITYAVPGRHLRKPMGAKEHNWRTLRYDATFPRPADEQWERTQPRFGLPSRLIRGSRFYRDWCHRCGEPIRVRDPMQPANYCLGCDPHHQGAGNPHWVRGDHDALGSWGWVVRCYEEQ